MGPVESDFECNPTCRIYCTVVSGFEEPAKEEAVEKFSPDISDIFTDRGALKFTIPTFRTPDLTTLRGIDNIYVVLSEFQRKFSDDKSQAAAEIRQLHLEPSIDWKTGFFVWRKVASVLEPQKSSYYKVPKSLDSTSHFIPSYRATCYRTGKHSFSSQEAMVDFGGSLNDSFGWKVDLTNFDVEVTLIIDGENISVCLMVTKQSLFRRNIVHFGPTTLRATIAYNMIRLGNPQPGDIICDPMCGSGAIPIEAGLAFPNTFVIGSDIHPQAWEKAADNVRWLNEFGKKNLRNVEIVEADVDVFPFRDGSIDLWVSDFPFGKRHKCDRRDLYPKALAAMARASKQGTTRAVIVTQDRRAMDATLKESSFWSLQKRIGINLGGLNACVYCLVRTCLKYS